MADFGGRERVPSRIGGGGAQHPARTRHAQSGGGDGHRERGTQDETRLVPSERPPSVK
jgi:hypothetical protein